VVASYTEPPKALPKVVVMSNAVTPPVFESVENVPLAKPPSPKVTPLSVQLMVEAFAGSAKANIVVKAMPKDQIFNYTSI